MSFGLGFWAAAGAGGGGGAGAYELISTTILTASQTSVVFNSIPTTYKHLELRMATRTDYGSGSNAQSIRLNGDTGYNYAHHFLNAGVQFGPAPVSGGSTSTNLIQTGYTTANNSATGIFNASIVSILDAFSTTKNKTLRIFSGNHSAAINSTRVEVMSGLWMNTAAITSLTIFSEAVNFVAGSRFSLYGIKG
jgi:hypothetical protein